MLLKALFGLATFVTGAIFPAITLGQSSPPSGKWCGNPGGFRHVLTINATAAGSVSGNLVVNSQSNFRVSGTAKDGKLNLRLGAATMVGTFTTTSVSGNFCWQGCTYATYARC
jgi:hypothetical protein